MRSVEQGNSASVDKKPGERGGHEDGACASAKWDGWNTDGRWHQSWKEKVWLTRSSSAQKIQERLPDWHT